MSCIGNKLIAIPAEVTVVVNDSTVTVKGPKGELSIPVHVFISVRVADNRVIVERKEESKFAKSLHGLTRSLIANMISGVMSGFEKKLELVGTGYRVVKKGQTLSMTLGFSHPIEVVPPAGVTLDVEGNTVVIVTGVDKQQVGQVAANIRALKPPEPYKGKGVRYAGEQVRRKVGKQAKIGAAA